MNRRFFLSLTALPLLSACGAAMTPGLTQAALTGVAGMAGQGQPQLMFSSITVNTSKATYDTMLAEGYRSRLGPDLKAALEEKFKNRISRMGLPLIVDVTRLGIAGTITTVVGEGQSVLVGNLRVRSAEGSDYANHQITARPNNGAMIAGALLGGGAAMGQDVTYGRLVTQFVSDVEEQLIGRTGIGAQILGRMSGGN